MPRIRRFPLPAAMATVFVSLVVAAPSGSEAEPAGTVLAQSKISSLTVNFGGSLVDRDRFGFSIANLGDLNGDGVDDFAVGAVPFDPDGSPERTGKGKVYVLFMDPNGNVVGIPREISDGVGGLPPGSLNDGDGFGQAVESLGDLDGPGGSEIALAVGTQSDDTGGSQLGSVWILFLDSTGLVLSTNKLDASVDGLFSENPKNDILGQGLAFLGDLDGAGPSAAALAVGHPGISGPLGDPMNRNYGGVRILFLATNGDYLSQTLIADGSGGFTGPLSTLDEFGQEVAALPDMNGDGTPEIIVGAPQDNTAGTDHGALYLLFLNADGSVLAEQKITEGVGGFTGDLEQGSFGPGFATALTTLGDIDGDGVADIAAGDRGPQGDGEVWVLFMNANGTVKRHQRVDRFEGCFGESLLDPGDRFGSALALMGDLDGDGFVEVAIGAQGDDDGGVRRGAIWVVSLADGPPAVCGDGILACTEECDDGNSFSGDGCDETCQIEPVLCSVTTQFLEDEAAFLASTGTGLSFESFEDPNLPMIFVPTVTVSDFTITDAESKLKVDGANEPNNAHPKDGTQYLQWDANLPHDGEVTFTFDFQITAFGIWVIDPLDTPPPGAGTLSLSTDTGESISDFVSIPLDKPSGFEIFVGIVAGAPFTVVTFTTTNIEDDSIVFDAVHYGIAPCCGDGSQDESEECDDGNEIAGDGCSSRCLCEGVCGDGVLNPVSECEECDDGNIVNNDGCSEDCEIERPQSRDQQKCINNLNKGAAKVMKRQGGEILSCLKNASRETLLGTLEECLTDDIKGKVLREQGKLNDNVGPGSSCDDPNANEPDFGFSSAATGGQASVDKELRLVHSIFGGDLDSGVIVLADPDKAASKCQQAVWKAVQKCQDTKIKVFGSCKKNELKGKNPSETEVGTAQQLQDACLGVGAGGIPDPKLKIHGKCFFRILKAIDKKCGGLDTAALFPGCLTADELELRRCLDAFIECEVCKALNEIDVLSRDCDLFDDGVANGSCP